MEYAKGRCSLYFTSSGGSVLVDHDGAPIPARLSGGEILTDLRRELKQFSTV
ncbi:hypothetical protein J6590_063834 [Homalodisca vitripennis]|nr:hypothetical protein J6590_063834 [Homalodisca vitripennis]